MDDAAMSLAIGSQYFGFARVPKRPLSTADFFGMVREALARVEGVHDVTVDLAGEDDDPVVAPDEPYPDTDYQGPHFGLVSVTFGLSLSQARKAQLARRPEWVGAGEEFRVHLTYGWLMPVSCVEVIGVEHDAVRDAALIAEHMEAELRGMDAGVAYRRLPTGLLGADILLRPIATADDAEFVLLEHDIPAWDRYEFGFDPTRVSPGVAAAHFVGGFANGEIDLHHQAADAAWQLSMKWNRASDAVRALRTLRGITSPRGRLRAMVRSGRLISDATLLLADAATFAEEKRTDFQRQIRQMYRPGHDTYLRPTVEQAIDAVPEFPVDRLADVIRLFETQRRTNRELAAILAASIGGGIVGALVAGN